MSTSTISQSLFRATIKKERLERLVKEIDGIASQQLYTSFVHRFLKKKISCDYLWEGLANIDQKIEGDVEENLIFILDKMNVAEKETLFLMSDQWRDPICLSTQKKHLKRLIETAWYPSDDLYILDEKGTWCIALTHHDFIIIARPTNISLKPARKKIRKHEPEVFAVHEPETPYE